MASEALSLARNESSLGTSRKLDVSARVDHSQIDTSCELVFDEHEILKQRKQKSKTTEQL